MSKAKFNPLARLQISRAQSQALKVMAFTAIGTLGPVLAQVNPAANGKNDPTTILKSGFCGSGTTPTGLLSILTSGGLIAIVFAVTLAIFGWNMKFGNVNAMESLKRSMIGMVVVLCASTIAGLFISGGC